MMDLVGSVWTHFSPNNESGMSETVVVVEQHRILHQIKNGARRPGYNLECVVTTRNGHVSKETIGVYDEHILSWLKRVA